MTIAVLLSVLLFVIINTKKDNDSSYQTESVQTVGESNTDDNQFVPGLSSTETPEETPTPPPSPSPVATSEPEGEPSAVPADVRPTFIPGREPAELPGGMVKLYVLDRIKDTEKGEENQADTNMDYYDNGLLKSRVCGGIVVIIIIILRVK